MYVGNYDFWYESSQLMQQLMREQNKKQRGEDQGAAGLHPRASPPTSPSRRQATSRKKLLDKLTRRGDARLQPQVPLRRLQAGARGGQGHPVRGRTSRKTVDGVKVLDNVTFTVNKGDKIAFVGENEAGATALFRILVGELDPDEGSFKWGVQPSARAISPRTTRAYFEQDFDGML